MERVFAAVLADWYTINARELPWRETRDPYKIWLSEVILQQTRVVQGLSYYNKFVENYPTVFDLAKADEEDVLRLWQGLGYYSRARNLHKCAKKIAEEYKGSFPNTFLELKKLPGIGDYTAAAIASFAFKEQVPVVDGNVFRVLARYYGIDLDISDQKTKKYFFEFSNDIISDQPDLYNQSVMEFGALQCVPKSPNCLECPLSGDCVALSEKRVTELPVKLKKIKVRDRFFTYLVNKSHEKIELEKRENKGIWEGLYQFPLIEDEKSFSDNFYNVLSVEDKVKILPKTYKHILSHQRLNVRFVEIMKGEQAVKKEDYYSLEEIEKLPKPVLIHNFLEEYYF